MVVTFLAALAESSQFTGYRHSQIVNMLSVLALLSIVMWIFVCLSIIVRHGAIILFRLYRLFRLRRKFFSPQDNQIGKHNG